MIRRRGFTLIELLVVIAIIALLVSLLMPSLRSARELAKAAICRAHLHNIGVSLPQYMADHNDHLPYYDVSPYTDGNQYTDKTGVTYSRYYRGPLYTSWTKPGPYSDPPRRGDGFLGTYLGTDNRGYRGILGCPSVPIEPHLRTFVREGRPETREYRRARSYAMNVYSIMVIDGVPHKVDGEAHDSGLHPRPIGDIHRPEELIYMCDAPGSYVYRPREINYDIEAHTGVTPNPRHLGEFNAVFVGGHVETGTLDDLYVNAYFYDDGP